MKLRVKAAGDAKFPRFNGEGWAPPGLYAGRDPARAHAPYPDGELVTDGPEYRKAIAVGDLVLLEEIDENAPQAPAPTPAKRGDA